MTTNSLEERFQSVETRLTAAMGAGDWKSALSAVSEGLTLLPAHAPFLELRFTLEFRLRRWRPAFKAYSELLNTEPSAEFLFAEKPPAGVDVAASFFRNGPRLKLYRLVVLAITSAVGAVAATTWGIAAALTSIAAFIAAILMTEVAYRATLYLTHGIRGEHFAYPNKVSRGVFEVTNIAPNVVNAIRGSDVVPNSTFVRAVVSHGRVVEAHTATSDCNGNVGFTDRAADKGAFNILVVGDSYTSFPGNGAVYDNLEGVEWPYFMKQALKDTGVENLRVLNFARPGHGILQMADNAANVLGATPCDLVIFAFVGDSLNRRRVWLENRVVGGIVRSFRRQAYNAPFERWVEQGLVEKQVSLEWAKERWMKGDSDPLLAALIEKHNHLSRRSSARAVNLFTLGRLLSWDGLFFGTPFIDIDIHSARVAWSKMEGTSYDDPAFVNALAVIKKSGAKILLCYLPRHAEIMKGKVVLTSLKQPKFLASLEQLTGERVEFLRELFQLDSAVVERQFPRYPHDAHPSAWGQQQIGVAIAHVIEKILPSLRKA